MASMTVLFVLLGLIPAGQSKSAPVLPQTAMTRAGWITGCWESFGKGVPPFRLAWTVASNDLIVGRSTAGSTGLLPDYGFLRIESTGGVVFLVRQEAGKAPERLALEGDAAAGELAFVGGPPEARTRISYRRDAKKKDLFLLRVATDGSKTVETPMKKDGCS